MRFFLTFLMVSLTFFSCKEEPRSAVDISKITIDFSIERFDIDFYNTKPENLIETKNKYPFLFPKQVEDSIWISKIENEEEQELFLETQKVFKDFTEEELQITSLFKYVKHYSPKFTAPKVITMLTNIDYENRVIYADSLLLISLDAYLGKEHKFYNDYPNYIKQNNHKKHLIVDIANTIIDKQISHNSSRTFLGKIIHEGKKMYVLDMYLPEDTDEEKIGYSSKKMAWAKANEEHIWKYFIEKKLLYSTDMKLNKRFLEISPFSKFYLEEDSASPGRIGVWLGWQIVRSYMQHNAVSLPELLLTNEEQILKKSKYKPRR